MKTNYVTKNQIIQEFRKSINKLQKKISEIDLALVNGLTPLDKNTYHLVSYMFKPENTYDKLLYSHIFKAVQRNELISGGSAYLTTLFVIGLFQRLLNDLDFLAKNETVASTEIESEKEKLFEAFTKASQRFEKKHLASVVSEYLKDKKLEELLLQAIELAGMEGNIAVENSQQEGYSVEMRYGYSFKAKTYKFFLGALGSWEGNDAKLLCIDGLIESVAEMEKILMASSKTKIPMVIIAQGFAEEVLATIKTNNDRKRFTIIPVQLEHSLDNLNVLSDIATCAGVETVSILKGDQLVFLNYEDIKTVEFIKVTETDLLIKQPNTRAAVATQIKSLLDKRSAQVGSEYVDVVQFLDNRIKNLVSHNVTIRLPNITNIERDAIRVKMDIALRTIRSMASHGFIPKNTLDKIDLSSCVNPYKEIWEKILDHVQFDMNIPESIPLLSLCVSFGLTLNGLYGILFSQGGVITDDEEDEI